MGTQVGRGSLVLGHIVQGHVVRYIVIRHHGSEFGVQLQTGLAGPLLCSVGIEWAGQLLLLPEEHVGLLWEVSTQAVSCGAGGLKQ